MLGDDFMFRDARRLEQEKRLKGYYQIMNKINMYRTEYIKKNGKYPLFFNVSISDGKMITEAVEYLGGMQKGPLGCLTVMGMKMLRSIDIETGNYFVSA
jgi:hypothetical protein